METREIKSVAEMHALAKEIVASLHGGEILLLSGELGSGKTTFTQGVAKALGVTAEVTSPTFTIMGEYEVKEHPTIKKLIHVDLYRLSDEQAQHDPLISEVLEQASNPTCLTIIEWADRLGKRKSAGTIKISFEHAAITNHRKVILEAIPS